MAGKTAARPPVIPTARLTLRPFRAADAPDMVDLLTDPAVSRTYVLPDFPRREDAAGLFARLLAMSGAPEHFIYGISLGERIIGFVNDVQTGETDIELGYVIAPAHWNRGYAAEALAACIEALFALGFDTVSAGYFEGNEASRRVMEKCGMRPACKSQVIVYRGQERVCIYYEISKGAGAPGRA
ncbi:MAG: GNAT family N-acetyltransferase [Clostridia bacterium]|nr:GNAT family N-acetyltransferase [Clostridia bacterium]